MRLEPVSLSGEIVPPERSNSAAVVILYYPQGNVLERFDLICSAVNHVYFVANDASESNSLSGLAQSNWTHIRNQSNVGLAGALNQGIEAALKGNYSWCLLMDQDSTIYENLLSGLTKSFFACEERACIGMLVPNYRSPLGNRIAYKSGATWQRVPTAVTSGSLVLLSAIRRIGSMKEDFFIEGIDLEFCLRLRRAGYLLIASGETLMVHGAGESDARKLFGRTVLVGHHEAWRVRLQIRNLTWIFTRYATVDWRWTCTILPAIGKKMTLVLLYEDHRAKKFLAALLGFCEGLTNHLGRPSNLKQGRVV